MADTSGSTTNGVHDPSGGPGVSRIPSVAVTMNERERELALNMLEQRLHREEQLVENFYQFSRQWISNQIDPRRNLYIECGWPVEPTIDMYRTLYEREPLATRVVEVYPKECWQQPPTVFEDMDVDTVTDFEQAWDNLTNDMRTETSYHQDETGSPIWDELQRADILSRIGSYGVILLGIDDGKNLQEPLDGVMVLNRRTQADSPMTPEEEGRLLNPVGRWKATDADALEQKEMIHSGPDRLGASSLSRNQLDQVQQWKWEREYRDRGMSAELACNTAKKRMDRQKRKVEVEHQNPCPHCKQNWPIDADPKDNDGRCPNCGRQVPIADLTENTQDLRTEVWAKSPAHAAKMVQNQVHLERGWVPKIISVKVLNANPEGHNQWTGSAKEKSLNDHAKKLFNDMDDVKVRETGGVLYLSHANGGVDTSGNPKARSSYPIGLPHHPTKYLKDEITRLNKESLKADNTKNVSSLQETHWEWTVNNDMVVDSNEAVQRPFDSAPTTNADGQYDSRDAIRTRGHRNPNNDERAPTERATTVNPNQRNPVDGGAIKPGKRGPFDPTKGPAQRQGDFAEVFGTDQQYDDLGYGIGMPPPAAELGYSLSGTDEQYFGVQFGPSEQPAPPTDPATAWPTTGQGIDGATDQDGRAQAPKRLRPRLLFMRPYSEDLVQVVRYEWNIRNPRFGYPVMYRITLNDPRETQGGVGLPLATVFVHWSRVIHLCDRTKCGGVSSNPVFTIPALKPVFNSILDAQKVCGAGAEGYYKSCFTGLQYVTHPSMGGDVFVDQNKTMEAFQNYQNGLVRGLVSTGGQWETIAPSVVDPTPHYNLAVEKICIVLGCPVRIFKGSERGELASSQDDESWNKRRLERQVNYLTPRVIVPLIDRLIQVGVLPVPGVKSGKQQVQNILKRQPQAKASRINGGWLVTNVRRKMKVANSNPTGVNQYSNNVKGMTNGKLKKEHEKNDAKLNKELEKSWSKPQHANKGAGDMVRDEGVDSPLGKAAQNHEDTLYELKRRGLIANIVSPSVGDHASRVAQALAMQKDNQQRLGDAKDQQARTGQAGGPDAWSKPLTGPDGEPFDEEFERPPVEEKAEPTDNAWTDEARQASIEARRASRRAFGKDDGRRHKTMAHDVALTYAHAASVAPPQIAIKHGLDRLTPAAIVYDKVLDSGNDKEAAEIKNDVIHSHIRSAEEHESVARLHDKLASDGRSLKELHKTASELNKKAASLHRQEAEELTTNSFTQEVHWDGTPVENAKPKPTGSRGATQKKAPSVAGSGDATPSPDYTSQPDSIGPADPAATEVQPGNFPHDSPRLNPGYDPPETGFSHATGAPQPTNGPNAGPAESKSRFEGTSRYGTDANTSSNPATDTGGGWEPPLSSGMADGGAAPWETGQTGIMAGAGKPSTIFVSDGGYSVEWPDTEATSRKDKAAIALQYTQALAAYVQGGCEATMPFKEYLVHIWGWEEELAQEMIEAAKALHDPDNDDDQPLTQPKMISGQPAEAADGTQAAADTDAKAAADKQKADAMKQSLDLKSKMGPFGGKSAGGSGMMKPGQANPPNKGDLKIQAMAKATQPKPPGDES